MKCAQKQHFVIECAQKTKIQSQFWRQNCAKEAFWSPFLGFVKKSVFPPNHARKAFWSTTLTPLGLLYDQISLSVFLYGAF